MDSKELAFWLYTLEVGETFCLDDQDITRVPGGWMWDGQYVPFNNEFLRYANEPTKDDVNLTCVICGSVNDYRLKEIFQGNQYYCKNCNTIIIYNNEG